MKLSYPRSSAASRGLEPLEERCLLSAAHHAVINTIPFSSAPAAVQQGLDALATSDSLTAPDPTQTVFLANAHGVETYTIDLSSTGTSSVLTVDVKGNPYSAPVKTTATFADITNTAVTNEINAIATALNLTPPADTTSITVLTNSDKTATYCISLAPTTTTGRHSHNITFSVNSNGDPVGNSTLPLSVFSTAIQTGLTSNAPLGATALTGTSLVSVQTHNGVTTYSATYLSTGIRTTVTVDATGALTSLPSTTNVQFSTIPTAAQTELQTLATANGYTGTIAGTQNVKAYDEANGTVIYAVRLPVTGTSAKSGATYTYMIAVASDQNGNPTVPPSDHGGGCDDGGGFGGPGGFGGFGGPGHGGGGGGDGDGGTGTGGTGGSTTSAFSGFSHLARAAGYRF